MKQITDKHESMKRIEQWEENKKKQQQPDRIKKCGTRIKDIDKKP